jgi:hypothetical protein
MVNIDDLEKFIKYDLVELGTIENTICHELKTATGANRIG